MYIYNHEEINNQIHTEEVEDIISSPPAWLLRWGITFFLGVLVLIVGLSAFIYYPDTIKTQLKINSLNSPKPIITKVSGKLVKLLVKNGDVVKNEQPLAYLESTAQHDQVLKLLTECKDIEKEVFSLQSFDAPVFNTPTNLELGELQSSYQTFYEAYLSYKSSIDNGFYLKKRKYLQNDLRYIKEQEGQLQQQKILQQRDFNLAAEEYKVHKTLADENVETKMELKQEESKFIARKSPLIQTESSLITIDNNFSDKQREIVELDNQITEEKGKFIQALNSLISDIESWKSKYVLTASESGVISFIGIIQENEVISDNKEVFYINSGNEDFFGETNIPQTNMGKVKVGQEVLVKFKSYPYQEYGIAIGKLSSISNFPVRDSMYTAEISFNSNSFSRLKPGVHLKYGMGAEAEIITENASLLSRLSHNLFGMLK